MSAANRVVVGYDGGQGGADALAFARSWTTATGDSLVVANVHPGAAPLGSQRVDAEWAAYERDSAETLLDEARSLVGDDSGVAFRRVEAESAAHGVHDLAEDRPESTPLVVVGSRRTGRAGRTAPGRTVVRLLQGSPVPVAVVPLGYADEPRADLHRLVLGYVATSDGRVALRHGLRMAEHLGASLHIVTAVPDTRTTPAMGEPSEFSRGQRGDYRQDLDEATGEATSAGVEATATLVEGAPHEVLAELGPADGDLLVVGSRGYGPVRSVLLGGVSHRVLRAARLPVVVVPRGHR